MKSKLGNKHIQARLLIIFFFILLTIPIIIFGCVMVDKHTNPFIVYWEDKFHNPKRDFIIQAFEKIPTAIPGQTALMLAADISEKDAILPLQKGYDLIANDTRLIYYDLMIPNYEYYKDKIKIIYDLNFNNMPSLDLVMASFILPFCSSEKFKTTWYSIDQKIKINGYFIGNFFDPDFEIFKGNNRNGMTFHTKQEVLDFFNNYEILKFKEVKQASIKQNGFEYYYEIFARKIK